MRNLIIAITAMLALSSCEDAKVSQGRELYEMYFYKVLKDPQSFVVYEEEFKKDGDVKVEWKIEYGARNGFGGMVRETAKFSTIGNSLFIDGSMFERQEDELVMIY